MSSTTLRAAGRWRDEPPSIAGRMLDDQCAGSDRDVTLFLALDQPGEWSVVVRIDAADGISRWGDYPYIDEDQARAAFVS